MAAKRIARELLEVRREPVPGITAQPTDNNVFKWIATIAGPEGSPYEGGRFHLSILFPTDYPFKPPQVRFTTHVFHPNISFEGEICLTTLGDAWSPALNITKVLLCISSLLTDPNADAPLVPDIGNLYRDNRPLYDQTVRKWVRKYAA